MTRTKTKSPTFLLQLLLAYLSTNPSHAFQPELLSIADALQAAVKLPLNPSLVLESAAPLDEILFVAANLLDSSQNAGRSQPQQPLFLLPSRRSISPYVQFPEIYQSASIQYDYETQPITQTIRLTPAERDLFELIRRVRNKYTPSTTIRVAGGWVRDKLLYGSADDIDFVLSDKSGSDFALLVCRYFQEECGEGIGIPDTCSAPTTAAAVLKSSKGEQSDHLQTASLSVLGFDIDFCRLRYERYRTGSRIPEKTGVASVVEDAWRRDLSINSLYYNIFTNQVEDWTEQGLQDLQLRNINTPKAPLPTLLEDPTRILRAIRFAAQLSFGMDKRLVQAARDVRVKFALQTKVSRDAIGNEIDSMFSTRDPTRGMKLLMETNLINVVLPLYDSLDEEEPAHERDPFTPSIYYTGLDLLARTQALVSRIFTKAPQWDADKRRYLWYAAFLRPIYGTSAASISSLTSKRGKRDGSGFYRLLATGLKRPKADMQAIETILKGVEVLGSLLVALDDEAVQDVVRCNSNSRFRDLTPPNDNNEQWQKLSDLRWLWYKAVKPIGPFWKEALILAIASSRLGLSESVDQYKEWVNFIENRLELDASNLKPLLDGSQMKQILPGVSGKGFKDITSAQEEWMVRHCAYLKDCVEDRRIVESMLIDYLVETFPQYAANAVEASTSR